MTLNIRQADVNDIKSVKEITKAAFKEYAKKACPEAAKSALTETDDDIQKDIETKYVSLAFLEDTAIGSLRIDSDGDVAYLSRFGVLPGYRSSGCGRLLLENAFKKLKDNGVKKLYLHTASKASTLMRFYYGRGFYVESVDTSRGYIRVKMIKEI